MHLILNGAPPSQLLRASVLENLDFIATGTLPPNPSELLLRPALAEWLDKNLPALVERMVAAEIARIVGKKG